MQAKAVTLTDYLIAAECFLFAALLAGGDSGLAVLRTWFTGMFVCVGASALFGGTVHGYFPEAASRGYKLLWPATLLSIGGAAVCAWGIGAYVGFTPGIAFRIMLCAMVLYILYAVVVLFYRRDFLVAVLHYFPAVLFALIVFADESLSGHGWGAPLGFLGVAGTLVAAAIQVFQITPHRRYFDHNALYHAVQAVALVLIYFAARLLIAPAI